MVKITKEQGIRMTWSTAASALIVLASSWVFMKPVISSALAEDTRRIVQTEIQPLSSAFLTLLKSDVANMKRKIARMKFRRDTPPNGDWTDIDNEELTNMEINLTSNEAAVKALSRTPTI